MNAKLTPGIILIGLIVGTLYGPLGVVKDITADQLLEQHYWAEVGAATVRSFAGTALAIGGVVAAALGLPLVRGSEKPAG